MMEGIEYGKIYTGEYLKSKHLTLSNFTLLKYSVWKEEDNRVLTETVEAEGKKMYKVLDVANINKILMPTMKKSDNEAKITHCTSHPYDD